MSKNELVNTHGGASVLICTRSFQPGGAWRTRVHGIGFLFYDQYVVTDAALFDAIPSGSYVFAAQVTRRNGVEGAYKTEQLYLVDKDESYDVAVFSVVCM